VRSVSALKDEPIIEHSPGIVLIRNQNTTIGYCRYFDNGDVEYIFVNSLYRRQGHGSTLLREVAKKTGQLGQAHQPISPLGRQFFTAHDVAMQSDTDSLR
jgi:ribosomal protein S18 acetylase RimI-like enzyme